MALRTITWTVDEALQIAPNKAQFAGVQGENNATKVQFLLPEVLLGSGHRFYLEFTSATGAYDKTDVLFPVGGAVSFLLPLSWTQEGGRAEIRLVAEKENAIGYTFPAPVRFAGRQTAFSRVKSLVEDTIQKLLDSASRRAEEAAVSADNAAAAAAVANAVLRESSVYVGTEEPQDEKITVWINPEGEATIDAAYNPTSPNAQSGTAVAQAVAAATEPKLDRAEIENYIDQAYAPDSKLAQSGLAVAQAVAAATEPKINRAELADYIVEQGAANGWTYRKWNSGLAECWGSASATATITTAWGGLFSADGLQSRDPFNVSFPFAFAQAPQVTATLKSSGTTAAILVVPGWGSAATTTRTGSYDLCRGTAMVEARTYTVCYYAMGSWK